MIDRNKIEKLCLKPYSFIVYDNKDVSQQIFTNMVHHYLRSLGDVKIDIIIEGDSLRSNSFSKRVMNRLDEEIGQVDLITQAVYDFIIDIYDLNNHKLATFTNELIISDNGGNYKVSCENKEYRWHRDPSVDRYSNMDYANTPINQNITDPNIDDSLSQRFYGLDFDDSGVEISNKPKRYRIKKQELANLKDYLGDLCDAYMKIRNKIEDEDFIVYDKIMQKSLDEIKEFVDNFPQSDKKLNPQNKQAAKQKPKTDNKVDRFATLDYNSIRRERTMSKLKLRRVNEQELQLQLIQKQDQDLDSTELQNKTAKKKLGRQSTTSTETPTVSKSVQKKVDAMSYQQAYDAVEDVYKKWVDADTNKQYYDTINLASNWYRGGQYFTTLVDSFKAIDDLYRASDIVKRLQEIEDKLSMSKSRTEVSKLKKEQDDLHKELEVLNKSIPTYNVNSSSAEKLENIAANIKEKEKEYIRNFKDNSSEWKDMFGKLEKMGSMIEVMDALRIKYLDKRNDIKAVTPRYKELLDTPIPSIIDVRGLENVDMNIIYRAWDNTRVEYLKKLNEFNKTFSECYDALAPVLAVKAKSRSLF